MACQAFESKSNLCLFKDFKSSKVVEVLRLCVEKSSRYIYFENNSLKCSLSEIILFQYWPIVAYLLRWRCWVTDTRVKNWWSMYIFLGMRMIGSCIILTRDLRRFWVAGFSAIWIWPCLNGCSVGYSVGYDLRPLGLANLYPPISHPSC